jgi:hypothetical protein
MEAEVSFDRRFYSAVIAMSPEQRAALLHATVCQECEARFLNLLLTGEARRATPPESRVGDRGAEAEKLVEDGLAYWGSGVGAPDATLFLAAELFAEAGRKDDAARLSALLSLYFSERERELEWHLSTLLYDSAVEDMPLELERDQVLFGYLTLSQVRTSVALGLRDHGARLLERALVPKPDRFHEAVRINWLVARVRSALGDRGRAVELLEEVLESLAEAREQAPCVLALVDLACLDSEMGRMKAMGERISRLRRVFGEPGDESEGGGEDYLGYLELLALSNDDVALRAAAKEVRAAVPSIHRYFGGLS